MPPVPDDWGAGGWSSDEDDADASSAPAPGTAMVVAKSSALSLSCCFCFGHSAGAQAINHKGVHVSTPQGNLCWDGGIAKEAWPPKTVDELSEEYHANRDIKHTFDQMAQNIGGPVRHLMLQEQVQKSTELSMEVYSKLAFIVSGVFTTCFQPPASLGLKTVKVPNPEGGPDLVGVFCRRDIVPRDVPFRIVKVMVAKRVNIMQLVVQPHELVRKGQA